MRAESHYDDESLIALLESGDDLGRDPHLAACETCSEVAASLREIAGALSHDDVWDRRELDEMPDARTITFLRGYADEMAREDQLATAHLPSLLAGSRDRWLSNLEAHPEYLTAGMVRALIAATDRALDTMPPDAVAMTEVATAIADALPVPAYASDTVRKLRGAAWRERAFVLVYVGNYSEAEAAVQTSLRSFGHCVVNEYDLGRVDIMNAIVNRMLDRDAVALAAGRRAVARLRDTGDSQRFVSAVMAQAYALMNVYEYKSALDLMSQAHERRSTAISTDTHARLLANIAVCQRALGLTAEAIDSYRIAAVLFEEISVPTEVARMRMNVATALRDSGRIDEAANELYAVREIFERFQMGTDAAAAELILAEIALSKGKYHEVEILCGRVIQFYRKAGVSYGSRALTALAFLTEAAHQRRLTPAAVRHVETYLRNLPSQPTLIFAPPPE